MERIRNVSTFLPNYVTRTPGHKDLHSTDFMLKDPNTNTELTLFGCAGKLTVILMQQFHFTLPLHIQCASLESYLVGRWDGKTPKIAWTVSDMRGRWRYWWRKLQVMRFLYCLASRYEFYFPLSWSQTRFRILATVYSECYLFPRLGICNFIFHLALSKWLKQTFEMGRMCRKH